MYHSFYHLVLIPKYRKKKLGGAVKERLETIMKEIAENKGLEICGLEVMPDHVHLFVSSPPQNSPSLLANWFKGISSCVYNQDNGDQRGNLHDHDEFLVAMEEAFGEMLRVLGPGRYAVVNTQDLFKKWGKCLIHSDYI